MSPHPRAGLQTGAGVLGALLTATTVAGAEPATVRVTHLGAPVGSAPLELVDARSGEVVANGVTDGDGVAVFEGIPPDIVFEAQTPNGRFASPPFRAGEAAELAIAGDARAEASWSLALNGMLAIGTSNPDADSGIRSPAQPNMGGIRPEPQTPRSDAKEGFAAGLGGVQLLGPALTNARLRPFVEASFEPAFDETAVRSERVFGDVFSYEWSLGDRWMIGGGFSAPLPLEEIEGSLELAAGFARQEVDLDNDTQPSPMGSDPRGTLDEVDEEPIDLVTVRLGFPIRVWRRGGLSAHLALGIGFAFPIGGTNRVAARNLVMGVPGATRLETEFDPAPAISGSIGLRFQYDHIPLPALE